MKQQKQTRLMILVSVLDYERTTLIGALRGTAKGLFNIFFNHLSRLKYDFFKQATPEAKEFFDEIGALYWELLNEFDTADNKAELLALIRAYNAGEVTVKGKPLKKAA